MEVLTVKQLISLLEKMPQDLPVISGDYRTISEPEVVDGLTWFFDKDENLKHTDKAVML